MALLASTTVDLARLQFATTSIYHFLFVPLTLGLGPLVAIMQTLWLRTKDERWLRLTKLLRHAAPDQHRDRSRDRPRAGVRVRHELVGVLEVRRQRLRCAAGDRGAGRVHARVDVPRPLDLRLGPAAPAPPPGDPLDRRARQLAVGLLHPRRKLVDAAPGGLQDRQRGGAADQRLGAAVERIRAAGLPAHDSRRPHLRLDHHARHLLLALPARPPGGALPQGGECSR